MKATAMAVRFSKSLARRRHRLSHVRVLSTTHRRGRSSYPLAVSDRFTIEMESPGKAFAKASRNFGPWYPPSANSFWRIRIKTEHGCHDKHASVTVLDVRRMNDRVQQQSYQINEDMPLLSLDLLASVVAIRIDAGPPFSALLTLWLSITQAVGQTSRPICSRHSMYRA